MDAFLTQPVELQCVAYEEAGRRLGLSAASVEIAARVGTPIAAIDLTKTLKAPLRAADLPIIRFHDLRHTAATFLLAQGVDPRTIMETLGHSQISLTLNTYSHVFPVLQRQAATRMDGILSS